MPLLDRVINRELRGCTINTAVEGMREDTYEDL